jgi:2-keto-3-deoxy-L-rhamnonate aldolase RhmA
MYRRNELKIALAQGRPQLGIWCSLASNVTAEIVAGAGYDWLAIDTEHSPNDLVTTFAQLQAVAAYPVEALVRPQNKDRDLIKQLLDIGARSLVLPCVESADEARAIVAATRYPMRGVRGVAGSTRANRWGRVPDYLHTAEQDIFLAMQIESPAGAANAEAIAAVDGVDALFVGPSDLAATMGHLGNVAAEEVQAAIAAIAQACKRAGKAAAILAVVDADARRYLAGGYTLIAIGADQVMLARACDDLLARFRTA